MHAGYLGSCCMLPSLEQLTGLTSAARSPSTAICVTTRWRSPLVSSSSSNSRPAGQSQGSPSWGQPAETAVTERFTGGGRAQEVCGAAGSSCYTWLRQKPACGQDSSLISTHAVGYDPSMRATSISSSCWEGLAHGCLNSVPLRVQLTASQSQMLDSSMRPLLQVKNRSRWTARGQACEPKPRLAFYQTATYRQAKRPLQILKSCFRAARWPLSASFAHLVTGKGARRRS